MGMVGLLTAIVAYSNWYHLREELTGWKGVKPIFSIGTRAKAVKELRTTQKL